MCFAARAAEWKMRCGLTQTELTTAASVKSRRSSNLRDGCEAGGVGRGRESAKQSLTWTKTYFLLKVLVEIAAFGVFVSHI